MAETAVMRIGALVPVRLGSERLPGKALLDLCGRPVLHHLLDRVARARHIADPRDIVVCATTEPSDDPLASAVESFGASLFRGSTHDIIRRFADAIETFGFDAVLQVNGDNPLSATEYMDASMELLLSDPLTDLVSVTSLPLGTAAYSLRRSAFDKVLPSYRTERNDTGFIYFFTRTGLCRHVALSCTNPHHQHPKARLTLDYPMDLELFRKIFGALYRPGEVFTLMEAIAFLNGHPELVEMNRAVDAEYWRRTADKAQLEYVDAGGVRRTIKI
jgi:spore coat polysaccharide biosynthesis protein SpsF